MRLLEQNNGNSSAGFSGYKEIGGASKFEVSEDGVTDALNAQ